MKPFLLVMLLCCLSAGSVAQDSARHRGVIVRMRMGDCFSASHGFVSAVAGGPSRGDGPCPEYTLVTDKVVYVIVGKISGQIIPLAETTEFRIVKNELLIRADDALHETRFIVKEMSLRPDWESERLRSMEDPNDSNRLRLPAPAPIEEPK